MECDRSGLMGHGPPGRPCQGSLAGAVSTEDGDNLVGTAVVQGLGRRSDGGPNSPQPPQTSSSSSRHSVACAGRLVWRTLVPTVFTFEATSAGGQPEECVVDVVVDVVDDPEGSTEPAVGRRMAGFEASVAA